MDLNSILNSKRNTDYDGIFDMNVPIHYPSVNINYYINGILMFLDDIIKRNIDYSVEMNNIPDNLKAQIEGTLATYARDISTFTLIINPESSLARYLKIALSNMSLCKINFVCIDGIEKDIMTILYNKEIDGISRLISVSEMKIINTGER